MHTHKSVLATLVILLLMAMATMPTLAQSPVDQSSLLPDLGQSVGANDIYIYPISPDTEAWLGLDTHEKMLEATQIPVDVLSRLSTGSLLQAVLAYPLYGDMLAYNRLQQGFDNVSTTFNGLQELLHRPDAANEIVKLYSAMNPRALEKDWTIEQQGDFQRYFMYVEILLAQPEILSQLSQQQLDELLKSTWDKMLAKQEMADVFGVEGLKSSLLLAGRIVASAQPDVSDSASIDLQEFLRDGSTESVETLNLLLATISSALGADALVAIPVERAPEDYTTYVTTPRGTRVTVIYVTTELTTAQISSNDAWVRRTYPQATLLRSSTKKYNCHSYAWHSQSSGNTYWMNSPGDDKYWQDGSYYKVNYCPISNAKVSYANGDHSAHIDGNGNFTSKWGPLGLVRHWVNYCPYNSSVVNYYKRS